MGLFDWTYFLKKKDYQEEGFNPKGVKIGKMVSIDDIDANYNFTVDKIYQCKTQVGEYADYDIYAITSSGPLNAKLRVLEGKTLLLYEDFRTSFDESLYDVLTHPEFSLKVDDNEKDLHAEYFRPSNVRCEYSVDVVELDDKNKDGFVAYDELKKSKIRLWDYERKIMVDGISQKEYLFVEMDSNHFMTMYIGKEILPSKVNFY